MSERTIEITISPTGEIKSQTKGYAGHGCLQASRWLEQALGVVTAERKTSEYYEQSQTQPQDVRHK